MLNHEVPGLTKQSYSSMFLKHEYIFMFSYPFSYIYYCNVKIKTSLSLALLTKSFINILVSYKFDVYMYTTYYEVKKSPFSYKLTNKLDTVVFTI